MVLLPSVETFYERTASAHGIINSGLGVSRALCFRQFVATFSPVCAVATTVPAVLCKLQSSPVVEVLVRVRSSAPGYFE